MSCQKQDHPKNKHSQTLRINFYSSPVSFHPQRCFDSRSITIYNALFEGLTRFNSEQKIELSLAKTLDVSPCKKIYTFTLRPSKWSNGTEVTSYDFLHAWKKALSPKSSCARFFFLIKNARKFYEGKVSFSDVGIQAPSNDQFIVELEHPMPHFLNLITDPLYSPIYRAELDKEPTVFNGPFIVENFEMDKKLVLSPNPLYWDKKSVKLKKIEITLVKDINTAFSMYEKKQSDWIGEPFSPIPTEALQTISNIKTEVCSSPFWIFFNLNHPKLQSANIRKALFNVINKKAVTKEVLIRQKELYTILPHEISNLSLSSFITNQNIEKGKALLDKGLKEIGMQKKDFEFTLKYGTNPEYEKLALYLKDTWEKTLGIRVTLYKEELNSFYSNVRSGNYEVGGYYLINVCDDPFYLMELLEKADTNHSKWENKDYQKYFSLARQSTDKKQRDYYLKQAEEILMDEMPVLPICLKVCTYACKENLKNLIPPHFTGSDFKWTYFEE